ncbi:uncharacterized protein LOC107368702 isoform X2 [Tetranychus urticae]|uniref:uncharacterized protein LOC107368702 isoform X2 n=1 Tax=Tetranychus urticae TaxID=32264 RepID=UPI00077BC4CE|nr:uncharacterized protein LOC107368702 isoform X2 [Tetranychus urticae]
MEFEVTSQNGSSEASGSPVSTIPTETMDHVPDVNNDPKQNEPEAEPVRGLELIYRVASELAARIAEEKRYEGIIKPCSVNVQRITDVSNFRIIKDPDRILQETEKTSDTVIIPNGQPPLFNQATTTTEPTNMHIDLTDSDDEEEMVLPSEGMDIQNDCEILQEKTTYFCVFCPQKSIQGRAAAIEHYQAHLDYYPYKCMICLEVLTNPQNLVKHFRADHTDVKTAIFKKKLMPWVLDWIEAFLDSQMGPNKKRNFKIVAYCPVCESSEKKEDIIQIPPNFVQPRKQFIHIYKHLLYEPYVCKICNQTGKKFSISDFDDRAYEHILKNHPEAEDLLLTQVYQKLNYIKPLEGFIIHYLSSMGVSTRRRFPEKIPHFVRNKFKAKHEAKEKEKEKLIADKDSIKPVTLGDLVNQSSSTSLQSNHTNHSFNGQSILKSDKPMVSNQVMTNAQSFQNTPSTKAAITTNKNVTFPSPPERMMFSPTKPTVITLPCGQLMVRNSAPNTPVNLNQSASLLKISPRSSSINLTLNTSKPPQIVSPSSSTPNQHQQLNTPVTIQIFPDVETIADNPIMKPKNGDFVKGKYLCIFCKESIYFETYEEALFHFSRHLNYFPVNCLLCLKKFQDINSINQHFILNHNHDRVCDDGDTCSPLLYYIDQKAETEKWIEENLRYQIIGEMIRIIDPDMAPYCPVCRSILNTIPPHDKPLVPHIDVVRSHINHHLNYKPYECFLCNQGEPSISVRFPSIGEAALKHLRDYHGYTPNLVELVKEFFIFKPIAGLENFIKSFLISDYYTIANQFLRTRDGRSSLPTGIPVASPQIPRQTRTYARPNDLNKRFSDVAGPPEASTPLQHKQYKNILACYHCKQIVSGPQELHSHTKSKHPNSSIAAYALPATNGY